MQGLQVYGRLGWVTIGTPIVPISGIFPYLHQYYVSRGGMDPLQHNKTLNQSPRGEVTKPQPKQIIDIALHYYYRNYLHYSPETIVLLRTTQQN